MGRKAVFVVRRRSTAVFVTGKDVIALQRMKAKG